MASATVLVVCGPSGAGKSTVGRAVAAAAGCAFLDADDFHPPANIAKMRAGTPLTDADRAPWLAALSAEVERHVASGRKLVLACSALKAAHRRLLAGTPASGSGAGACSSAEAAGGGADDEACGRPSQPVAFALLLPPREALARRLAARQAGGGHFMPAALLDSQLAALEAGPPSGWLLVVADERPPGDAAAAVAHAWLGAG
ncbi:MAG: carbohydrate kinase [Monoraphidium minutum]|nr:MAG: carbohydrate kinase [Monoraphidium minutum]